MAQRRSRKKSGPRSSAVKKPELRKPQVLPDGTPKPRRRESQSPASRRPSVRMRPDGKRGLLALALTGWVVAALALLGGLAMHRWYTYSFPDWAWLYIAFGMLAAAPAIGYVSRERTDVGFWVTQAGLVSLGALLIEATAGPACPTGADCGAYGARGVAGVVVAVVIVLALGIAGQLLGVRTLEWARERRPRSARSSLRTTLSAGLGAGVLMGLPLAALLLVGDSLARPEPQLARKAVTIAGQYCFPDTATVPALAVRPDPVARSTSWTALLVHRVNESRAVPKEVRAAFKGQGLRKSGLPSRWLALEQAFPYEAAIVFDQNGDESGLDCRKLAAGTADAHDVEQPTYGSESPIKPKELLQAPATPPPPTAAPAKKQPGKK